MKTKLTILLLSTLFIPAICMGQPQTAEGVIQTNNGVLLYSNKGENSYTFNLSGEVDISAMPLIKLDGEWFQFLICPKGDLGKDDEAALLNYMKLKLENLCSDYGTDLSYGKHLLMRNGKQLNFWKYRRPEAARIDFIPANAIYNLNTIHNDFVFVLSYPSQSGDDNEALKILLNIFDNFKFYNKDIDLKKLQKNIKKGINSYEE